VLRLRVLSWNLGPGGARWQDLAAALAGWEWDVALLRDLPARWPVAVATALDAEFRCPSPGGAGWMRRLLGSRPAALLSPAGAGETDAILARYDRIVAEWPVAGQRGPETTINAARLACGVWVGNVQGEVTVSVSDWASELGREAIVLAGPQAVEPQDASLSAQKPTAGAQAPILSEVARGGADGLWATMGLVPVDGAELLAEGTAGGGPPHAITLERRP
jgi:hypothetical protein